LPDAGTAFENLSIDIAAVKWQNIGAQLQRTSEATIASRRQRPRSAAQPRGAGQI
jgi:uncharacterized protein YqfA (UPF0365 family)